MADRSVASTDTLNYFRHEFNGTAADVGDIQAVLDASSYIASSTDVIEAIVALNAEIPEITTDAFVFPSGTMVWEGATDDDYETTLSFTDPTADRTWTFPDGSGGVMLTDNADTSTAKTLTTPTLTSPVLNTAVSGSAVLDEDDMSSNSATKAATQQSIKAYIDNQVGGMDLDVAADSGSNIDVDLSSEVFTVAGGTNVASSVSGTTVTLTIDSGVATLAGTETFTNKTFTSPTIDTHTLSSGSSLTGLNVGGTGVVFEGSTADAHETTLTAAEPTQDNTITIPNSDMTLLTTATHVNQATHIVRCIALG